MSYMRDATGRRLDAFEVASKWKTLPLGPIASNRISWINGTLTNTVSMARVARLLINGSSGIRLLYSNAYKAGTGEDAPPNGIHVKAALEYPVGSIIPVTFGGKTIGTIQPGSLLISDPVALDVLPGTTIYERVAASPPMPPSLTATGSTTGGALAAATYYVRATALTDAGESNASTEVSVATTGATGSITVTVGDKNLAGVDVRGTNLYLGTSAGAGTLLATLPPGVRTYTITGTATAVATTLNGAHSNTRVLTVVSTAGIRPGDLVTVTAVGDFTVQLVASDTSLIVTANVTATTGTAVTLKVLPPSTSRIVPAPCGLFSVDANEGNRNGNDLVTGANGFSFIATTSGVYAAAAVLAQPSGNATAPKQAVALIGDSIMAGTGWASRTTTYRGFAGYALADAYPSVNLAVGGEGAYQLADTTHSSVRMTLLQHAAYSISNYGTNDLARTLTQIKAAIVTIAQRAVAAGVKKHWQTTLIPKAASTDGWQTYGNQTASGSAETNRLAVNVWLRAPASAGAGNSFLADVGATIAPFVGVFDTSLLIEMNANGTAITLAADGTISNGAGGLWKVYGTTQYDTNAGTISGTSTTVNDTAKAWTVNQWAGYMLSVTTSGTTQYTEITSNTATALTTNDTLTVTPTSATTYYIYKGPTIDGTHPTDFTHKDMAAAIDTSKLV